MTTRFKALTVVLAEDIREDDAEYLMNAIRMLKNVIGVSGVESSPEDMVATCRVKRELREKLYEVLK